MNTTQGARLQQELIIRTENRIGLVGEISRVLSDMGLSLIGISFHVEEGEAIIHLLSDAQLYARDALRNAGFSVDVREVILIELPDHPGFLCRVAEALARKDIDIEELYATITEGSSKSLVVCSTSHNGKAIQLLRKH
ncbi:ACT domain-containing protein [Candidatus Bipolaricaulota bacterium]|nr:ACT domain-containing protein [Candidatus Bipolaricaulota bacterium]